MDGWPIKADGLNAVYLLKYCSCYLRYEKQCQALLISLKMNSTKEKDDQQDER